MLKMTIDGEEVVSKNNFTIKEEMLSPSSTILNNTYPKTWEDDKNYTSRFYYPKDYAKLDIQNFSITPEEAGTTIDIVGSTTLTDVDTTKESRVLSLKGQTSQTGTPTPTSPIPVNVVSGDNEIKICGKNLIPTSDIIGTSGTTSNGITFTRNSDGSITANGTATSGISIYINADYTELSAGTYTFSDGVSSGESGTTFFLYADVRHINDTSWDAYNFSTISGMTQTIPEAFKFKTRIVIRSGQTLNNVVFKPMLEKNSSTTSYEPYTEHSYPIYLGVENLFNSNLKQGGRYFNNGNFFTADNYVHNENPISVVPGETYTLSATNYSARSEAGFVFFNNGTYVSSSKQSSQTFTVPSNANQVYCDFYTGSNVTPSDITNIQLEKGTKANTYTPYGTTPIELCKIGTYQDYIYKDNGSWYLHKEIGKVVLDGSESWGRGSGATTRSVFALSTFTDRKVSDSLSDFWSDKFGYVGNAQSTDLGYAMSFNTGSYSKFLYIQVPTNIVASGDITNFKTWLSNNNTIVYYVLATPTTTLITDTTLLEQLDALESQ